MTRVLAALVVIAALAAPARADLESSGGDSTTDEANAYHRAGEAAYKAADFPAAVAAFQEAYRRLPRPQTVFSLAQAYRQIYVGNHDPGTLIQAVELYRQYLAAVPRGGRSDDTRELLANLDPLVQLLREKYPELVAKPLKQTTQIMVWSSVSGAEARIDDGAATALPLVVEVTGGDHRVGVAAPGHHAADLKVTASTGRLVAIEAPLVALPARLTLDTAPGAAIYVDGVRRELASSVVELTAGGHTIWAGARGHLGIERTVNVGAGEMRKLAMPLPTTDRRRGAWWMFAGAAGVIAAGAGALSYSLYRRGQASNLYDLLDSRPWMASELASYQDDRNAARDWKYVSIGLVSTAVIAAVVGAWLYVDDTPHPVQYR